MKLVFNPYKNNLEFIINSNIDDRLSNKDNYSQPSKLNAPAFWLGKAVLLLYELFGNSNRATSSNKNNSKLLPISNLSLGLPPGIMS